MFHRIPVHIVKMRMQVDLVANGVFPVASLPDIRFSLGIDGDGMAVSAQAANESGLDHAPSSGIVVITFRQSPDRVQMVRHDDGRNDHEWAQRTDKCMGVAQLGDCIDEQSRRSISKRDREEERAAGNTVSTVSNHRRSLPRGVPVASGRCRNSLSGDAPNVVARMEPCSREIRERSMSSTPDSASLHPGYLPEYCRVPADVIVRRRFQCVSRLAVQLSWQPF